MIRPIMVLATGLIAIPTLFAQTRLVDFTKLQVDANGEPRVQAADTIPLTAPTHVSFDKRKELALVHITPALDGEGITIATEAGNKASGFGELKWQANKTGWNHLPIRVQYWFVPRKKDKAGGSFRMKFRARAGGENDGGFLGTRFSAKGTIELGGIKGAGKPYLPDQKYMFEWLVDFQNHTATVHLNVEDWLKEAPLPDNWLADRGYVYISAGQEGGGGTDAQWDFGGLIVEEAAEGNASAK